LSFFVVLWNLKTKSKSSGLPDKSMASGGTQPAGFVFAFKKKTKGLYSFTALQPSPSIYAILE